MNVTTQGELNKTKKAKNHEIRVFLRCPILVHTSHNWVGLRTVLNQEEKVNNL